MIAEDMDQDGHLDLLLTGNSNASKVQTGYYDALLGLYLKGDGQGNFTPEPLAESGFYVPGDGKALALLHTGTNRQLALASQNSGNLLAFERTEDDLPESIQLSPFEFKAIISLKDGSQKVREFYYGSGYLSQSSRWFSFDKKEVKSIEIYDFLGEKRSINY
jgi:hypothetical protein